MMRSDFTGIPSEKPSGCMESLALRALRLWARTCGVAYRRDPCETPVLIYVSKISSPSSHLHRIFIASSSHLHRIFIASSSHLHRSTRPTPRTRLVMLSCHMYGDWPRLIRPSYPSDPLSALLKPSAARGWASRCGGLVPLNHFLAKLS
jgi:hypothetical protein